MNKDCARAEILAGAIALGEASDQERDHYRRHIAACSSCLSELRGEREIERIMETISLAKESEIWEPVPLRTGERRARRVGFAWRLGGATAAVAIAASLGIHALVAASTPRIVVASAPEAATQSTFHVTLERRQGAGAQKPKPASPGIVVVHNVITLKQTDRESVKPPVRTTETVVARAMAQAPVSRVKPAPSDVPVWRRDHALPQAVSAPEVVAREQTAPVFGGHAESIAVAPSYIVRDVTPIGGDTAINPHPASIAYAMGAEGTTAFEVSVDEHGAPVKCTITKSSGYLVLDVAVCKAAMQARYSPRTINGRATMGLYRDAFTFRATNNSDAQL